MNKGLCVYMYDKSSYSSQTIAMHAFPTALVSVTDFLTPAHCALRWCNITQIAHTRKKCHTSGHCFKLFADNFHTSSQFPQHILQLLTYSASTWYIRRISLWKSVFMRNRHAWMNTQSYLALRTLKSGLSCECKTSIFLTTVYSTQFLVEFCLFPVARIGSG